MIHQPDKDRTTTPPKGNDVLHIVNVRSFNAIMKDAVDAKTTEDLEVFAKELMKHKKKYPLVQLWYAQEVFTELYKSVNAR